MSDIDTVVMDSLKVLDPNRPIREADMTLMRPHGWPGSVIEQLKIIDPLTAHRTRSIW